MSQTAKKPAGSKKMMIFGAIVLVFAVIGLVATVTKTVQWAAALGGSDQQRDEYEWFICPLVMQDPPPFDNPDGLSNTTVITAGVWRLIMNEDTSKYPIDEFNFITVPASDVEVQIKALFGDVDYQHETVGDTELMITYDQENKTYIFPAVPHILPYTPQVESIGKADENGLVTLTVGYIPPGLVWEGDLAGSKYAPEPEKMMDYVLKIQEDGSYILYSVRYPTEESAGASNNQ